MKNVSFWKTVLPGLEEQFGLEKGLAAKNLSTLAKGLKKTIDKMDGDEFNLFLAQVVIKASAKQIMGVDLTAQIMALKELRKQYNTAVGDDRYRWKQLFDNCKPSLNQARKTGSKTTVTDKADTLLGTIFRAPEAKADYAFAYAA